MSHNLVPHFILEKYESLERFGRFNATALFVDISGFSAVTDKLMIHGQHGAEILAGVMGAIFEPLINSVYSQGGFVTGFAGDAFTAVFPSSDTTIQQALAAAVAIQEQMKAKPEQETPYGRFVMSAKVGLAFGEVIWGIVTSDDDRQASYYFQGTAIDGCAAAEHAAGPGDVILDNTCYNDSQDKISAEPIGDYYKLLATTAPLPAPKISTLPEVNPEQLLPFVPEAAIRAGITGEFRQVVNVFISLPTVRTEAQLEIFMKTVFKLEQRYGGFLKQLDYGDKGANLLLFWGAPTTHENDVHRALHFILDLQTQTAIPINGGITYHVAHAGYIGSTLRGEYTCYGRGVNLAARFMTGAPRGEIWVDERIANQSGSQFDLEFEEEKKFKGFTHPQKVFILYERLDNTDTLYDGRLVGREEEITKLSEFIQPIYTNRHAGLLVVRGEAGAGKSRLTHEFLTYHLDPETQVFLAQCDEILRHALNPFRYWLKRYFGLSEGLAESRNKRSFNRKLDSLISQINDPPLADALDQLRSFLGALIGLQWPDSLYEQVEAKERHEKTLSGLATLLKAESRRQPLILLLEDVHWIDEESATFLSSLLTELEENEAASYPIAMLSTARYEGHSLPLQAFSFQELNLSKLSRSDLSALAQTHLESPPAENLVDLLVERAEGNPFFAEQILRYLQENQQLAIVNDHWQVVALDQSPLPGDVNALLVARLDRLSHSVKEVVQTAAVLGREFEIRLLSHMLKSDQALQEKISHAEGESIWSALNEIRYIFNHALLRDAAYRMQLRASRQALHKLALEALENLYQDDLSNRYGELSYHALAADLTEPAFHYSLAAGNEAMKQYVGSEAIVHYQPALALLEQVETNSEQRRQLFTQYGRALELTGDMAGALAQYETMEKLALKLQDKSLELSALVALGKIRATGNVMNDFELAETLGQKGLELAEELDDKAAEATIRWNLMNVYRLTGRYEESRASGLRAYELAELFNLREQMAYVSNDLSTVLMGLGEIANMVENAKRTVELWREIDNGPMLIDGLANLGMALSLVGKYDEALAIAEEGLARSQAANNRWGEAYIRYTPLFVHLNRLEIEAGLTHAKLGYQLAKEAGAMIVQFYISFFESFLYLAAKDYDQTILSGKRAKDIASKHFPFQKTAATAIIAIAYMEMGHLEKAAELVNSYQLKPGNLGMLLMLVPELAKSQYMLIQGNYSDLFPLLNKVTTYLEKEKITLLTPRFYLLQAQGLLAHGKPDEARKVIEKGLTSLKDTGGVWGFQELADLLATIVKEEGKETAVTTSNEMTSKN